MKLKFRIEMRKIKQARIVVLRILHKDGKVIEKALGSFSDKRSYEPIVKQLTTEELYEFENFVSVMNFSKFNFNCPVDELDRLIIKIAPEFKKALFKIWKKAKAHDIDFIPESQMLSFLLNKAKTVEQQLAIFTQGEFKALGSLGVDIADLHLPLPATKEDQKLLIAAIENSQSLDQLTELFNTIAVQKYQKAAKFKPHHFEYLAHATGEQQKKQTFPKWYYTIAIDVLNKLGVKLDTIVSPTRIAKHWLRLNKKETFNLTLKAFNQQIISLKDNPLCIQVIKNAFIDDELAKMHKNPQVSSPPSIAIERWLKRWKEKNPTLDQKAAIQAFNTEFTMLTGNPFLIKLIEKHF